MNKSSDFTKALSEKALSSEADGLEDPSDDFRLPSKRRIKRRDEFQRVFKDGKVAVDEVLVVHAVRAGGSPTRLGISVAKKVGSAPIRNRWKRLIREAFRLQQHRLPAALLLVVRPRRGASPDFPAIRRSLIKLAWRIERKL